jgi:sensor histidine kinase YesM/streptogramin lyase
MLFLSVTAHAQEGQELWFRPLHAISNYSSSFNYFIYQDSEGLVWISSSAGLNCFDGLKVQQYTSVIDDTSSLADDNIQSSFFEDRHKNLWFSSSSAIHCYRRATNDFLRIPASKLPDAPEDIHVFFLEQDSLLWYSTGKGVYRYNIYRGPQHISLVTETSAYWHCADTMVDGRVQFLYGKGAFKSNQFEYWLINSGKAVERKRWFDETDLSKMPNSLTDIFTDVEQGISWVGTDMGLVKWDRRKKNWELIGENRLAMCDIFPWKKDQLLCWTKKEGLSLFNKITNAISPIVAHYLEDTDLVFQEYFDIYIDRSDNLWIPFTDNSLMYANLNKTKFKSIPKATKVNGKNINYSYWALLEAEDGTVWHGSTTEGLFRFDKHGKNLEQFEPDLSDPHSMPGSWVTSLANGNDGRIWVGTRTGLAYFKEDRKPKFVRVKTYPDNQNLEITYLLQTSKGLLAATENHGLFKVEESHKSAPKAIKILDLDSPLTSIYEDSKNNIYISRSDKEIWVYKWCGDSLCFQKNLPLVGVIAGYVEEADGKTLWIGSWSGLSKVNLETMRIDTLITAGKNWPSKTIHSMLADGSGNIWMGTPLGLVKFFPGEQKFRNYSLADGTRSSEFYFRAATRLSNGDLWFGGSEGITIVPKDGNFTDVKIPPKVIITGLEINFQRQPASIFQKDKLVLTYSNNTLSFEFAAIEFSDPTCNQLFYKLENADNNWVEIEKGLSGIARYPKLRFGDYTFKAYAINSDGISSDEITLMFIRINRPWYQRHLAYLLYGFIAIALVYAYSRFRVNQIRKKEAALRKEAEYKQKEAEYQRLIAETETAVLRLQMNPHFIFNSMNSISSYILEKDIDTANDYLGRFAKLMRMILKFAAKPLISIADEINLLEQYMQTEAMRVEHPFTFNFEYDDNFDPDDYLIPTMILQPFVENAIWHGLSGKGEGGHIRIRFWTEGHTLNCSVEDNGIGREAAAAKKPKDHESKALSITEHRLGMMERKNGVVASYRIEDIEEGGVVNGTRVLFCLPLL